MSTKVDVSGMAGAINDALTEYAGLTSDALKTAVKATATSVKKEIKNNAPVDTGAYSKSWATKKTAESANSITMTVYSKNRYQIAHLLEYGHAKRGGGRVQAYPHIEDAQDHGQEDLVKRLEKALK